MKNNTSLVYSIFLVVGDAIAVAIAFTIAYILRVSLSTVPISAHVEARTFISILSSLLPFWILIFALLGLYRQSVIASRFSEFGRLLVGSFIGILFVISYGYVVNINIFPARLVVLYGFLLSFFFVLLFRTSYRGIRRWLFSWGVGINNVLIVGNTAASSRLMSNLARTDLTGYKVIGVVKKFSEFEATCKASVNLHTIIQTELFADAHRNDSILTYAQNNHISYRFVPGNSELFVGKIEVDLFHSVPIIAVHQTALIGWGTVVKRLTDIILGGLLLVLASPFMLVIAILEKLSDGGAVFFRQERLSRFGKSIKIYKFRSHKIIYNGLDPEEAFVKMGKPELVKIYRENADSIPGGDPRVSRLGNFLRNTKLDELPQLINVVRGDISLIGPRALIARELNTYDKKSLILSVRSGMTGLAQISGIENLSFEERRALDLYYVQNWTFLGDIVILIKTVWIVLARKGTR